MVTVPYGGTIQAKPLIFSKKSDTSLKIICGIYHDDAKPHSVRGGAKKRDSREMGSYIYPSKQSIVKSIHLAGEYGEISILISVIFFNELKYGQK